MNKPNPEITFPSPHLASGTIVDVGKVGYRVSTDWGDIQANKAFSCLVQPRTEDRVLLSWSESETHILAVLDRPDPDMTLSLPGKATILAADDLTLSTAGQLTELADEIVVTAKSSHHCSESFELDSEKVTVRSDQTNLLTRLCHSVIDQVVLRARTATRTVEGTEICDSGNLLRTVRELLTIRSKHGIIDTQKDLKIDGEHIHMG